MNKSNHSSPDIAALLALADRIAKIAYSGVNNFDDFSSYKLDLIQDCAIALQKGLRAPAQSTRDADRIEALEAALREITSVPGCGECDLSPRMKAIACAALAGKQEP
jgi:hypothetical protein